MKTRFQISIEVIVPLEVVVHGRVRVPHEVDVSHVMNGPAVGREVSVPDLGTVYELKSLRI